MQIFSTFENHVFLEIAISNLEKIGIKSEDIYAVPLDNREESRKIFDTLHRSDGISLIDIAMPLATVFAVVTASIGFKLSWGPIYWGLIGAVGGFMIGFLIRLFMVLKNTKKKHRLKGKQSEVILIVDCDEAKGESVEKILWEHFALGLAKVIK
ncbi:hypothetical protein [Pseudalkalibacillus hwajinpoensis]|uniref:Uncharacterized protein n=1 Tax=Guptibacillus hwajinpoensis TaxID=208199 RepID=A0A4U1MM82_9BACL|nr:hypothetical protein [Pseudalkalibacillus hwajinpoensis]TKD72649.1 hypothetical protein FBF83_05480 [Pseudalkalibacillus hwajinpoensis]